MQQRVISMFLSICENGNGNLYYNIYYIWFSFLVLLLLCLGGVGWNTGTIENKMGITISIHFPSNARNYLCDVDSQVPCQVQLSEPWRPLQSIMALG